VAISVTVTHEANRVVREMAESHKKLGQFLSALILQERARREERQQCQAQLQAVYRTGGAGTGLANID
jgi:hypothetical protein